MVYVEYKAGFTRKNFPADLKEAIAKMFIVKKINFLNRIANSETLEREVFTSDIKAVCDVYKRKSL